MSQKSTYSAWQYLRPTKGVREMNGTAEIKVDYKQLDELTEKVSRLNELLEKTISLIGSLREEIKA